VGHGVALVARWQVIYTHVATAILSASLSFYGGWTVNQWRHDASQKQAIEQAAAQQRELHALEQARSRAALDAQNLARQREVVLRADAAAARTELARVRTATQQATDTARADPQACPDTAASLGVVFDQCAAELAELGTKADRHVSDIRTLLATP
jgi:hypothetical protein